MWNLARTVNDQWAEHKGLVKDGEKVFPTKLDYLAEVSRVCNFGLKRKRFTDTGETLRRWCETVAVYETLADTVKRADEFLDLLTFDHLWRAKRLYKKGKVKSPFLALSYAMTDGRKTAEEMEFHFDPPAHPDEWEVMRDRVEAMQDKSFWKLKSAESVSKVLYHVAEIRKVIAEDK
jgi:hypothetical protein